MADNGLSNLTGQQLVGYDKGVRTVNNDFKAFLDKWTRCRDCADGADAVKGKKDKYLPKLLEQPPAEYINYVIRANFFNATGRTTQAMLGMLFRKSPNLVIPDAMTKLLENVTLDGCNFDIFTREVAEENILVGRVGVLVDYSQAVNDPNKPLTIAQLQTSGARPVMKMYTAETILNWKYKTVGNATLLSQVVLMEQFEIVVDEFTSKWEPRYRVLDLDDSGFYRVRVFRIDDKGEDQLVDAPVYPLMNGQQLNFIPFEFFCPDGNDSDIDEPPMLDLVDVNLSHYRTSADYEHACHFTALPMLYVAGMSPTNDDGTPAKIYLGSQSALIFNDPTAKAAFVEFTGQGLTAIENSLDRKEQMMAVLGARMLEPQKKAAETAFTSAIHAVGENSILASISIALSLGLTKCLTWFADWAGLSGQEIEFEINRDFLPVAIDGQTLTAYVAAWQAGALTAEEIFDLFKRADLIESDVEFDEHTAEAQLEQAAKQQQQMDMLKQQTELANHQPGNKPGGGSNTGVNTPSNKPD